MNIGEVSKRSGLTAKTIRYYEDRKLLPAPSRTEAGYRAYTEEDLQLIQFLAQARATGFTLEECRELIDLHLNPQRRSKQVKALVLDKLDRIDNQIETLRTMQDQLKILASRCAGDEQSDCAILNTLNEENRHE